MKESFESQTPWSAKAEKDDRTEQPVVDRDASHESEHHTAKQCRLGLFQDSVIAGDLEDSKSTSGGTLCVFGSHTLVPMGWMCKKQTLVSHSSTESEIISLDAGLRLMVFPLLIYGI